MQQNRSWIVTWGPWIGAILAFFIVNQAVGYLTGTQAELRREARDRQTAEFLSGVDGAVQPADAPDAADLPATIDASEEATVAPDGDIEEVPVGPDGMPGADPTSLDIEAEVIEPDDGVPLTPAEETEGQFEVHPAPEDGGVQEDDN